MAKKLSPDRRMRKAKRIKYARIIYYTVNPYTGRVIHRKRRYSTFAEAISHLTNVKLGFTREHPEWQPFKPARVEEVSRYKGQQTVLKTTIFETEEQIHERARMGRPNPIGGLTSERNEYKFSLPKNMAGQPRLRTYDSWRSRSTTGSSTATTVDPIRYDNGSIPYPDWLATPNDF